MAESEAPHFDDLHHLLWDVFTRSVPIGEEAFADTEMTLALAGVLDMIGTWPGSTAAELSRRGPSTQQAVSQHVAKLEKLGYVERRVGRGRGVGLHLTGAGEAARTDSHLREDQLEERLRGIFGEQNYTQLIKHLATARSTLVGGDN